MELKDAISGRRSVRKFRKTDIPEEIIIELIEIANMAPSAGNLQSRDFILIRDGKTKEALAKAALNQGFIVEAPWLIVVTGNEKKVDKYGLRGKRLYTIQDAAASIMLLLLAAYERGLGTCWVGAFDDRMVSDILNLPEHAKPMAIIPIGYPEEWPPPRGRHPLYRFLHRESW